MEKIRIQKLLSSSGTLSRRKAEEEIAAGRVLVDGRPAEIGEKVDPAIQTVTYRGKPIESPDRKRYFLMYKPRGVVCTMHDEKGRRCIADLLKEADLPVPVLPVGRLDLDSEGLLLLTNDGECINRLTHPSTAAPKIYLVKVSPEAGAREIEKLRAPMVLDGYRIRPVEVSTAAAFPGMLRFVLHEGRNRQIRKMCEACNLSVKRLIRIGIGELTLGDLRPGEIRELSGSEIKHILSY